MVGNKLPPYEGVTTDFTSSTMPARFAKVGDLHASIGEGNANRVRSHHGRFAPAAKTFDNSNAVVTSSWS